MDPKNQLSGLDPKLKEAYERVMGTTIPLASPPASPLPVQVEPAPPINEPTLPPPSSQQPPPVVQEPVPPPVAPPQPPEPTSPSPVNEPPPQPEPPPIPQPVQPPVAQNEPTSSPVQPTGFVAASGTKERKKGAGFKLSPPLMILIGVALFFLYIFFWMRVFNLSLF